MSPLRDDAIRLRDGRRLAFVEWGDPEGAPVFFFHGMWLSRFDCPDEAVTASSRVRLVTVDRPGVGGSDVLLRRTYGDWPSDVVELADALEVERFGVVGWSAGGPYAAACAARIPERLTGVGIGASDDLSYDLAENPAAYEGLGADLQGLFELARKDPDAAAAARVEARRDWVRALQERPETLIEQFGPGFRGIPDKSSPGN